MSQARTLTTRRVPALVTFLNPLIRRLLGSGLPFGPNVLITVRGRTSGIPRTFPVAIIESGGARYIQSPFGEVNWVRNLRAAGEAVVSRGNIREDVDATEVGPEVGGPVLQEALAPYLRTRLGSRMVARLFDLRRDSPPEDYVAVARHHPIFELRSRALDGPG
jgi:deazaflavin-dependent oxidoreductase (nitroreductase family)